MIQLRFIILLFFMGLLSHPLVIEAAPTTSAQAQLVVTNWLAGNNQPLEMVLGEDIKKVESFYDANDEPLYHIVYLNPAGFVIVAGDDQIEPIIGFAAHGSYDPSPDNPLGALISQDLPNRIKAVRNDHSGSKNNATGTAELRKSINKAQEKWLLLSVDTSLLSVLTKYRNLPPSDLRVAPLLETEWDQAQEWGGNNCYNLFTPNNYVCGCVATAMAQVMNFFEWPTSAVGTPAFTITVDGQTETASLRGGDGAGGAYNWNFMDNGPTISESSHREAIGALTSDVGISLNMSYRPSGSEAQVLFAGNALVNTFGYSNAVHMSGQGMFWLDYFIDHVFIPNLDAGLPMIVGIPGCPGHAVVFDGYGYDTLTLYHHINFGWGGISSLWYNLHENDTGYGSFSNMIYNIYKSGSGIIISGRVTDSNGDPVAAAQVTADQRDGGTYTTTTNSKGIYAFVKIPSLSGYYTITVEKSGLNFTESKYISAENISRFDVVDIGGVDFTADRSNYPDLIIEERSVAESTVTLVQQVTINATVKNQGTMPAPDTWMSFYLSTDSTISVSDEKIYGSVESPSSQLDPLNPGEQKVFSMTTPAPPNIGTYWYGACVFGVKNESNTWNNCSEGIPVTIIPPVPAAPANISAGSGDFADHIIVNFFEATYATSYSLYRCTTESTSSCSLLPGVNTRSYDDYAITDGSIYYYRVKACNTTGCSDYSWAAGGYMAVQPTPPEDILASDGIYHDRIVVSWSGSDNQARNYSVHRCTTMATDSCTEIYSGGSHNLYYTDTRIVNGTTYYYRLMAGNMAGLSDYSEYNGGYSYVYVPAPTDDVYEPDDTAVEAKTLAEGSDSEQHHSIQPARDIDWATFTITSSQCIHLETTGYSGDTRLWLYDNNLNQIAYDDNSGSVDFSVIDEPLLPPGTYYVKIDENGNNEVINDYLLLLRFCELPRELGLPSIFSLLLGNAP